MTLYHAWLARNDARDGKCIDNPESIAKQVVHLMEEWYNAHEIPATQEQGQKERWLPSDVGWTKVNSDGALRKETGSGGGGVVVRDHDGGFLAGASHFPPQRRILKLLNSWRAGRRLILQNP